MKSAKGGCPRRPCDIEHSTQARLTRPFRCRRLSAPGVGHAHDDALLGVVARPAAIQLLAVVVLDPGGVACELHALPAGLWSVGAKGRELTGGGVRLLGCGWQQTQCGNK